VIRANLVGAQLRDSSFLRANLKGAVLKETSLAYANLLEAKLEDADLQHSDLSKAIGLTREMLEEALTDDDTITPADLNFISRALAQMRFRRRSSASSSSD